MKKWLLARWTSLSKPGPMGFVSVLSLGVSVASSPPWVKIATGIIGVILFLFAIRTFYQGKILFLLIGVGIGIAGTLEAPLFIPCCEPPTPTAMPAYTPTTAPTSTSTPTLLPTPSPTPIPPKLLDDIPLDLNPFGKVDDTINTIQKDGKDVKEYTFSYSVPLTGTGNAGLGLIFRKSQDISNYKYLEMDARFDDPTARCVLVIFDEHTKTILQLGDGTLVAASGELTHVKISIKDYLAGRVDLRHITAIELDANEFIGRGEHFVKLSDIKFTP